MNDKPFQTVRTEQRDWLGVLTLDRPERMNTLTPLLVQELGEGSVSLLKAGVKVVLITGDERAFSAGADLSEVSATKRMEDFYTWTTDIQDVFSRLEALSAITIAAIDGFCLGGGLELAMRCDYRLATSSAKLGLPEIKHGLLPTGGGLTTLVELVGLPAAKDLVLSGRTITPDEAVSIGLVTEILPSPIDTSAASWAERFSDHPRLAIRAAKQAFRVSRTGTPAGWSEMMEALTACLLISGEEAKDGIAAFLEKRKPSFP